MSAGEAWGFKFGIRNPGDGDGASAREIRKMRSQTLGAHARLRHAQRDASHRCGRSRTNSEAQTAVHVGLSRL